MSGENDSSSGALFRKVIEANDSQRESILEAAQPSVRAKVEQLLAHDAKAQKDGLLDNLQVSESEHGRFVPGTQITDRYRIVSLVGRGGMGKFIVPTICKSANQLLLSFHLGTFALMKSRPSGFTQKYARPDRSLTRAFAKSMT